MDYHQLYQEIIAKLPKVKASENHPLAPYTTLNIGGPANIFIHTTTQDQFISIVKLVHHFITDYSLPITDIHFLGNGSNVLISDSGLPGLVIKNSASGIKTLSNVQNPMSSVNFSKSYTQRHENEPDKYLDFNSLDYDESGLPTKKVTLQAGTLLPIAINSTLNLGLTGLQWFSYIPGTIGAATWYNLHGGSYHFSDFIESVKVFNLQTGKVEFYKKADLSWTYEKTYFQQNPHLVILSATLNLFLGDVDRAKNVVKQWIGQKSKVQPMNSAGSVFANPSLQDCIRVWGEQKSAGWIIDHELNWKGKTVGGAQISPLHANFIVNTGNATASDYLNLARSVQSEVLRRFNIKIEMEVRLLGNFKTQK